jgi:general secretion pathway protein J
MKRGGRTQRGFTLLEILVALVVLGFLIVGLAQGVSFGLHAWDSQERFINRQADMDAMERVLRELVATADPGALGEPAPFHGEAHTLAFVARLPMSATGLVTRSAQIGLGVDAKHRLVLRWRLHPHAERLTPLPPPRQTVLLEGVDRVDFSYFRQAGQGGGWVNIWDRPTLPQLVRITVAFHGDDRRFWPTIEAAPMLSRPGA